MKNIFEKLCRIMIEFYSLEEWNGELKISHLPIFLIFLILSPAIILLLLISIISDLTIWNFNKKEVNKNVRRKSRF